MAVSSSPASSTIVPAHLLVVDDDAEIALILSRYFGSHGFRVSTAGDGIQMRHVLDSEPVDIVMLDIGLPGEDGFSLTRNLRGYWHGPVIIVTGRGDSVDRIVGLELGADDYVTKPFNPRELLARIRAILRRAGGPTKPTVETERSRYRFDRWILDVPRRALLDEAGNETALGTAEFRLLHALITRPGVVLTRDQLLDITAGRAAQVFDRSIDNLVSRLRKRIERDPQQPSLIRTVWGDGYVFAAPVEDAP